MEDWREPFLPRFIDDGSTYVVTRTVMLRLLGVVYLVAFLSALLQGPALIGEDGLLPMRRHLDAVAGFYGWTAFFHAPSIFWISTSDAMLVFVSALGLVLAFSVIGGVTNAFVMIALWLLQTSLVSVGQVFWAYGWEIQLLETGMLAAFLCPASTFRPFASAPPTAVIWLMRWLVVRVMLGAGLIKLRGDPCWKELTCLVTHYETQPNPSPLSWAFHHMPRGVHVAGALFNFFVELVVPFGVWGPRRLRHAAGVFLVVFQLLLIASGNLSFLNWLTIVPALACFDDSFFARLFRREAPEPSRLHRRAALGYAALVGALSIFPVMNLFSSRQVMNTSFDPLRLVNTYGAFGTVSRTRDEIVIEGSADGQEWLAYEFPCKPGDPERRPCLVTPYHYRLDWQMWFAAMSSYEEEPWIAVLVDKLLRGDRTVKTLLARDPFPDAPPRFVRADLYRYELRGSGKTWWTRRKLGEYMRPLSLDDPELDAFLRERGHR